jgi:8-oxo-dGTP diphosphatase
MARDIAITVVFDADRKQVLLQKREDFRIWALPGGGVELNEAFDVAAIRETYEETGYEVSIQRLVAEYQRPQLKDTIHLFEAYVVGGEAVQRSLETVAVRWFPVDKLPRLLAPGMSRYIADTLANHPKSLQTVIHFSPLSFAFRNFAVSLRDFRERLFPPKLT